jgi:CopG family nickel-responsive transcriptional regulator
MAELARIAIAIGEDLLQKFDTLIERRGYTNRSEAVRDLIRNEMVNEISGSPNAESLRLGDAHL